MSLSFSGLLSVLALSSLGSECNYVCASKQQTSMVTILSIIRNGPQCRASLHVAHNSLHLSPTFFHETTHYCRRHCLDTSWHGHAMKHAWVRHLCTIILVHRLLKGKNAHDPATMFCSPSLTFLQKAWKPFVCTSLWLLALPSCLSVLG